MNTEQEETQKAIDEQMDDIQGFIDTFTQNRLFRDYKAKVAKVLTKADEYQLNYWAWRIAMFTNWGDAYEVDFQVNDPEEPTELILTFNPDYGS